MENNNILEQLAIDFMLKNNYHNREIEEYYVGGVKYFRVSFWIQGVCYREFSGTLEVLINKLSN